MTAAALTGVPDDIDPSRPSNRVLGPGNRLGAGWNVLLDDVRDYRAAGWKIYSRTHDNIEAAIRADGYIEASELFSEQPLPPRPRRLLGFRHQPARRPRQRRSHRTVAKSSSGDSGDDPPAEPPGPGNPHTATIGGVP